MSGLRTRAEEIAADLVQRVFDARRASTGSAILLARAGSVRPEFSDAAVGHVDSMIAELPTGPGSIVHGTLGAIMAAIVVYRMTGDSALRPVAEVGTRWLSERASDIAERHRGRRAGGPASMVTAEHDAITGITALGGLLLAASSASLPGAEAGLLTALAVATDLLAGDDSGHPSWRSDPADIAAYGLSSPDCGGADRYLTGMAHGVAGPLALLASAATRGKLVEGQSAAIRLAANWLITVRNPDRCTWPLVPGEGSAEPLRLHRRWCTGTAGIARSLQLAGTASGDADLSDAGVTAMIRAADLAPEHWDSMPPELCCGVAGILQSAVSSRRTSTEPGLDAVADAAAAALLAKWRPELPLGFDQTASGHSANRSAAADLLYGSTGIALALYDYAHGDDSTWPSTLLLQ